MRLIVNGASHEVTVPGHETLLVTLRERLALTGAKLVCGRGECGACTVLLDGRSAYSCLTLTAACANQAITTIEGIGREDTPHALQAAFIEHDALHVDLGPAHAQALEEAEVGTLHVVVGGGATAHSPKVRRSVPD